MATTAEERELLRDAQVMGELVALPQWKRFVEIIESQMKTREEILINLPLTSDGAGVQLAGLAQVKGARLGLKLAIDTPQQIISDAGMISREGDFE